jgi:tetratricopeptide (TPR) repeat protein
VSAPAPSPRLAPSPLADAGDEAAAPASWFYGAVGAIVVWGGALRGFGPGWPQVGVAVAGLAGTVFVGLRLELVRRLLLALAAALVLRAVTGGPAEADPASRVAALLGQLAYFAVPPLLVHLLIVWRLARGLAEFGLAAPVFYAPVALAFVGVAGYEALVARAAEGSALVRLAYGALYAVPVLALLWRELRARTQSQPTAPSSRAASAEEEGRFSMAGRYYAQGERFDKAAEMAERAGEWARAADLYRRAGEPFRAAEMAFRAGRLEQAFALYEQAGVHDAAARVAEQLGRVDEAARLFERAGDAAAVVRVLEAAGRRPSGDLYARVDRLEDAVVAWQEEGQHARAAEALEQDFQDLEGAAQVCFNGRLYTRAAQLFERLGNRPAAIAAYLASPDTQIDAARLCLSEGDVVRAGEIVAALPPATRASLDEDDDALLVVAEVEEQTGQLEAAVQTLQKLRRRAAPPPAVFLPLGRCLYARGLVELAEENLRTALELKPGGADELEAAYLLGCVLEERGKNAEAAEVYLELMRQEVAYRDVEQRYRRLLA